MEKLKLEFKRVTSTIIPANVISRSSRFACYTDSDKSGEYVMSKIADDLIGVLTEFVEWNKKYPSSRIYSEIEIRTIAKELDAINEKAVAVIAETRK